MESKRFACVMLICALLGGAVLIWEGKAAGTEVYVSPASVTVKAGEELSVNVSFNYVANLYGYEFWLSFNNTVLNATDLQPTGNWATIPAGWNYPLNPPVREWYWEINNPSGYVTLARSTYQTQNGKTGGGDLGIIHFKALRDGNSLLHLYKTNLVDDRAMEIGHTTSDGQVTVSSNTPPVVSNVAIHPLAPLTNDDLTAEYVYFDADGDAENGTEIRWYKNGTLQLAYNDLKIVRASVTAKGDVWYFTVRPNDGKSFGALQSSSPVTVQNTPPMASYLGISPSSPSTTDNLVASYVFYDADGDLEMGSEVRWYDNGVLQSVFNDQLTVSSSATAEGEVWNFTAKPKDGTVFGGLQASAAVIIRPENATPNTPPVASNLTISPRFPGTTDDLVGSYVYFDADGDAENGTEIRWFKNGVLQSLYDDQLLVPSNATLPDETWFFIVKPNDGKSFGILQASFSVTISSAGHDVAIRNVTASKTVVGEGRILYVNVTVENKRDMMEPINVTCYANVTLVLFQNITLYGLDVVTVAFAWNTTQAAIGNYIVNASVMPVSTDGNMSDNTYSYGWIAITIPGDIDCDGRVTIIDIVVGAAAFTSRPGQVRWNANADVNDDGVINILDIAQLALFWWQFQLSK